MSSLGPMSLPRSPPKALCGRPSAGRMTCGRPPEPLLPGCQTRNEVQRAAMMPGFFLSAQSRRSRSVRLEQWAWRHLKAGIMPEWLKMTESEPGSLFVPPVCSRSHGQRTDHLFESGSTHSPRWPSSSITPARSSVRRSSSHFDHQGLSLVGRPRWGSSSVLNENQ